MDNNVAAVLIDLHKTGKYEGFIRGGEAPLEKNKKNRPAIEPDRP